jgi:hypothetical protein
MIWSKAKTAVVISVIALLAGSTSTALVIRHLHQPKPQSTWVFSGYANPRAALMSYLWASACQSDRQLFEASLTPAQQLVYERMIIMNMKVPQLHSEAETVADTFKRANEEWQGGSYRILDQQTVSSDQVILHVFAKNSKQNNDVFVKMKRIGNEWKYDGFKR